MFYVLSKVLSTGSHTFLCYLYHRYIQPLCNGKYIYQGSPIFSKVSSIDNFHTNLSTTITLYGMNYFYTNNIDSKTRILQFTFYCKYLVRMQFKLKYQYIRGFIVYIPSTRWLKKKQLYRAIKLDFFCKTSKKQPQTLVRYNYIRNWS